jgi:hypothetical protein
MTPLSSVKKNFITITNSFSLSSVCITRIWLDYRSDGRSQWPRGLRRRSSAARLLRLWVRIPRGAWMFVCCEYCVLSGRGLCDGLITRPEKSYRLWGVVVCDQETSKTRRLKPATGLWKIQTQWVVTPGKHTKQIGRCHVTKWELIFSQSTQIIFYLDWGIIFTGGSWRRGEIRPSAAFANRWRYTTTPHIRIYGVNKNNFNFIHLIPAILNTQNEIPSLDLHWGLFNTQI